MIYSCVLTECNTLYKFVTTQRDDLCQIITMHNVQRILMCSEWISEQRVFIPVYCIKKLAFKSLTRFVFCSETFEYLNTLDKVR